MKKPESQSLVLGVFPERLSKGCCELAPLGQNMPLPRGSPTAQVEPGDAGSTWKGWRGEDEDSKALLLETARE